MLKDTQERYGLTWRVTPDMLGILSASGLFEATNPAWTTILGWTAEEIESRPFFDFVHPDDIERTEQAFVEIQEGKPILQFVNRYRRKDGDYRWLSWNCVPEKGKFYCSARDITEDVLNKSALASSEEDATLREQFIAVLSHDLRNPLAALQSGFYILGREAELSDRGRMAVEASHRTVRRMTALIEDLMDFARARLGSGLSLDISDGSDLADVLEATVEEIRVAHPGREIRTDIDLPVAIACDVGRISQLASNLVANAVVHGQRGAPIALIARSGESGLQIAVTNEGPTLTDEVRRGLFKPFVREEVRPSQEGLGLGLFISSEIAKAHGGELVATSEDDVTTFRFVLPRS